MKCNNKDCQENNKGQCALGRHPSWPTCIQNSGIIVTKVEGVSFDKHKEAYEKTILYSGCFDIPGTEDSRG